MAQQEMLINHVPGEESRIAIVEGGRLEELYTERASADLHVGNIYRGKVTNVESSIQAAFVDFGEARSGFLHISDLHPRYFPGEDQEATEKVGKKTPRKKRPPIQQCLKRGQQIVVQVLKEGIGAKGPTLTTYLSVPGRYLVMMPYMERHGVSRKIDDPEKRREIRQLLDELDPPDEMGFIVRTAGLTRRKNELKRDLNYLVRLWKDMRQRMDRGKGPAELYTESDLIIRTLRDVLTTDVTRIVIDDERAAMHARQFLRLAMPRAKTKVIHYHHTVPLLDAYGVEKQIQQISQRQVTLPSGVSLVFDQTEALVAVDVNSGKFRNTKDAEDNAYQTNCEAVEEIARQLRLRDLGGLLVLDLIDMYVNRHRREVERRFREQLKKDRARTKVLKISDLGMLEMTRQRMRPSLKKSVFDECPTCGGTGQVLSPESLALDLMRRLAVMLANDRIVRAEVTAHPAALAELLNRKRSALAELERRLGKPIEFTHAPSAGPDQAEMRCYDSQDRVIDPDQLPKPRKPQFTGDDEITLDELKAWEKRQAERQPESPAEVAAETADHEQDQQEQEQEQEGQGKKRRRRRRGGRKRRKSKTADEPAQESPEASSDDGQPPSETTTESPPPSDAAEPSGDGEHGDAPKRKKRRRGRRGGRRRRGKPAAPSGDGEGHHAETQADRRATEAPAGEADAETPQSAPASGGYEGRTDTGEPEAPTADAEAPAAAAPESASTTGSKKKTAQAGSRKKTSKKASTSKKAASTKKSKTGKKSKTTKKSKAGKTTKRTTKAKTPRKKTATASADPAVEPTDEAPAE